MPNIQKKFWNLKKVFSTAVYDFMLYFTIAYPENVYLTDSYSTNKEREKVIWNIPFYPSKSELVSCVYSINK